MAERITRENGVLDPKGTIGFVIVSHGRDKPFASRMLGRCSRVAIVFASCFVRILFVFSWYSAPLFAVPSRDRCCKPSLRMPRYGHLFRHPTRADIHFTLFSFQIWISVP